MQGLTVPRVEIPGLTDLERETAKAVRAELEAASEHETFVREQQRRMGAAMVALGKPVFRRGKPKRKKARQHGPRPRVERAPIFQRLEAKKEALAKARAKGAGSW